MVEDACSQADDAPLEFDPLALQWGIVKKTCQRGSLLVGNCTGDFCSLMQFRAVAQTHRFQTLHVIGSHLNLLRGPRTNAEWAQVQRQASAAMETLNLNRAHHHGPWLVRTYMCRNAAPWYLVVEGRRGLGFNGVAGGN